MKICSICQKEYEDEKLNFCLNDGGILIEARDEPPPTVQTRQVRTTQPNWSPPENAPSWGSQPLQNASQNFYPATTTPQSTQNQTLPTVSLVLGSLGILLWCCYGGLPFGIAAIVTGYLGYQNVNQNPQFYSGRGMAIAGMILGAVSLVGALLMLILGIAGSIFK